MSGTDDEVIDHTSSERARNLLEQGFVPTKLSDYLFGKLQAVLTLLASLYGTFLTVHGFDDDQDSESVYYTDKTTGCKYGVATIYYKLTDAATSAMPQWTISNVDLKNTAFPSAKLTVDYLRGKQKTFFANLILNPYLPRLDKLRETENVIRQIVEKLEWAENADKYVVTGIYNNMAGWQWFIASEYYVKYVTQIEKLFYDRKIQDLAGNTLKAYSEAEVSEMVTDITKREKRDNKRKMVVFINSKTAVPNVQLEEIRQNAIQATQTAQDQVYEYSGEKPFDKPVKPKNPKTVTVSASVSEKSGKHGAWWRITLWILVACEKMSLVPASIWKWSLPGYPSATLVKHGTSNKHTSNSFADKAKAAWKGYSSASVDGSEKKGKGKAKSKSKSSNFGGAAEKSSSAASSSGASAAAGIQQKSKSRKRKTKPAVGDFLASADSSIAASDDMVARLEAVERQMVQAVSADQCQKMASKEVTKRFKRFEEIMHSFSIQMQKLTDELVDSATAAEDLSASLESVVVSDEERAKLVKKFSYPGMTDEHIKMAVEACIKEQHLNELAIAKKVSAIGVKVYQSSLKLTKVQGKVCQTVEKLAQEAGADFQSPKIANKKRARITPGAAEGSQEKRANNGLPSGLSSDSDSSSN